VSLLDEPVAGHVGPGTAKALAALDIRTVGDLLWHLPRRYERRGDLTDIAALRPGEHATVMARVESASLRRMQRRRGEVMDVVVTDGNQQLHLTFFSRRGPQASLVPGRTALFSGKVDMYRGRRQLVHPEVRLLDDDPDSLGSALSYAGDLIPVYPASAALPSWRIGKAVATVLGPLRSLPDPLPEQVCRRHGLIDRAEALRLIHDPPDRASLPAAQARLRYEEAFVLQVELARRRAAAEALPATPRAPGSQGLLDRFDRRLPFDLTPGQREVGAEIEADLAQAHPMHRLLQGDVGSGKTVVALRAMLAVADTGGQAALLAPTEVLAVQHERSLRALLGPLAEKDMLGGSEVGTRLVRLTGTMSAARRRAALAEISAGTAGIVVGTHALLSEHVQFADLGLVVIDEQHRFGVEQRASLVERPGSTQRPHVLVMTATPIPRTVAMTAFGDLDVSVLADRPPGRLAVTSHVVPVADKPHYLTRTWQRAAEEVAAGHRVFVVCPRIGGEGDEPDVSPAWDEDDDVPTSGVTSVLVLAEQLREGPLRGVEVGVLHGRMSPEQKDAAMARFVSGQAPVLVATTVVEVGVDVPEATTMIVMDAERYGVAQLHQLRGRVGRGDRPGLCLLVTGTAEATPARLRLDEVARTSDGFALAELDLAQRREGDLLGAAQTGRSSSIRVLSLVRDLEVIQRAREDAAAVVAADPTLAAHPLLAAEVRRLTADRGEYLERS
jgi:ATP-dependent DNA helicase RecG